MPVIRNSSGDIDSWFETEEEAKAELMYRGEEYELSFASIDEIYDFEFGGLDEKSWNVLFG